MTAEQLREEIKRLDPQLEENSSGFESALVLLASVIVGPNADRVASFTGLKRETVREKARNLTASGVWENGKVHANWFEKKNGIFDFWLDTLVADGLMERVP